MLIIVDAKMPLEAKTRLKQYGELLELQTAGITYPVISGHPDIFFCPTPKGLIVAPNLPETILAELIKYQVRFTFGRTDVGSAYPYTSHYNVVSGSKYLIHNLEYTDKMVLDASGGLTKIHVNQGYTRCNLISLDDDHFITSDQGIQKTLSGQELLCHYFPPHQIQLQGFEHGFIGGTCGIHEKKIFLCGSLKHHSWGALLRKLTENAGYKILELTNDPLRDIGSIFFIDNNAKSLLINT